MALTGEFKKSTRSGAAGHCTEARLVGKIIQVRDSKNPDGPVLEYTCPEWEAFLGGVKDGEFDLPA